MRLEKNMFILAAVVLSVSGIPFPAGATLIFDSVQDLTGTGLGAVNTVLTIQSPGSTATEQGCVGRIGGVSRRNAQYHSVGFRSCHRWDARRERTYRRCPNENNPWQHPGNDIGERPSHRL